MTLLETIIAAVGDLGIQSAATVLCEPDEYEDLVQGIAAQRSFGGEGDLRVMGCRLKVRDWSDSVARWEPTL